MEGTTHENYLSSFKKRLNYISVKSRDYIGKSQHNNGEISETMGES